MMIIFLVDVCNITLGLDVGVPPDPLPSSGVPLFLSLLTTTWNPSSPLANWLTLSPTVEVESLVVDIVEILKEDLIHKPTCKKKPLV